MTAMSIAGAEWDGRVERSSEAKSSIMTRRSGKEAGLGALSALMVARRRRIRGVGVDSGEV